MKIAFLTVCVGLGLSISALGHERYDDIVCGSDSDEYQICSVRGYLLSSDLLTQYSVEPCKEGFSFGAANGSVFMWTSHGCRGLFRVHVQEWVGPYPD